MLNLQRTIRKTILPFQIPFPSGADALNLFSEGCVSQSTFFRFHPVEKGHLPNVKGVVNTLSTLNSIIHNENKCGNGKLYCCEYRASCVFENSWGPPLKKWGQERTWKSFPTCFDLLSSFLNKSDFLCQSQNDYMVRPSVILGTYIPAANTVGCMWRPFEGQGWEEVQQARNGPGTSWAKIHPEQQAKFKTLWSQNYMNICPEK